MNPFENTRRGFIKALGLGAAALGVGSLADADLHAEKQGLDKAFLIKSTELDLEFTHAEGRRRLSFSRHRGAPESWRQQCLTKLKELVNVSSPEAAAVVELRRTVHRGVTYHALIMRISDRLSIPAYMLVPPASVSARGGVIAIHGHGEVESCIGVRDEYHHSFALELARAGHTVLAPALRGFGVLADMAAGSEGHCLDYWSWKRGHQFTLVTDAFLRGETLIGQTIEDLLRWESWFCGARALKSIDAVGISYGGDLALTYPVFSKRVRKIFCSGSLGSFAVIFSRCYNAPAHCIPGVLEWMDRSDIAGLNAPRPIMLHYGERDRPGPRNSSASYNETVEPSIAELRAIYAALGASGKIDLVVTPGRGHEMDNVALKKFLAT